MSGGYESISTVIDPEVTEETRTRRIPPYHVVVLNDEDHTFEYVIEMLIKLFAHSIPRAKDLTWEIHSRGRAIVYTTHKEKAELKREQVLAYGAGPTGRFAVTSSLPSRTERGRSATVHGPWSSESASGSQGASTSGQPASR